MSLLVVIVEGLMSISVGLGLSYFPFCGGEGFWRWVSVCEEGGIDSLWQSDRLVTNQPILECMSVMAALAGATSKIKFGMNVASLGNRDPLLMAKQCATIDVLSGGRLLPAFGVGNIRSDDWGAVGLETEGRGQRTNEGLEIITRLWREESVTFEGKYFQFRDVTISPKPLQKRFPVWIGGSSVSAILRTAKFGTGWQAGFETPEEVELIICDIKKALLKERRHIEEDHYGAGFGFRFGSWDDDIVTVAASNYKAGSGRDPLNSIVAGTDCDIATRIEEYVNVGVSKFVLRPIAHGDDDVVDQTSQLIEKVLPALESLGQ